MLTHRGFLSHATRQYLVLLMLGLLIAGAGAAKDGEFADAAVMGTARQSHTATLLPSGKVLVVGGTTDNVSPLSTAELYDPATNTWSSAGSMTTARTVHTATLLLNGKVLVAGGAINANGMGATSSAELYDPVTNTWSSAGTLITGRHYHTATLLSNGKVLIAAGTTQSPGTGVLNSAEIFDPATNIWSAVANLATARYQPTATLLPSGKVLITGGYNGSALNSTELYDPTGDTWISGGNMAAQRQGQSATLLGNGKVLVAGGTSSIAGSTEIYDPAGNSWSTVANLNTARVAHCATLLPNGKVLVAAGTSNTVYLNSAELYDPVANAWTNTSALPNTCLAPTSTLLSSGKVLVAGGYASAQNGTGTARASIYDPTSGGGWSSAGSLNIARTNHTTTLLPNGTALVVGGSNNTVELNDAEQYDSVGNSWSTTGSLATSRSYHTATLLPNGKVLVAGGVHNALAVNSAELYDPAAGTWSPAANLTTARFAHVATLLGNGKVLVAGGHNGNADLGSAEIYDPAANTWSPAGSMLTPRLYSCAVLLTNGKVLVPGGYTIGYPYATNVAELYDPTLNTWSSAGTLNTARYAHITQVLASGKVLVAGGTGNGGNNWPTNAELFDPVTNTWSAAGTMSTGRTTCGFGLLSSGKVLVAGGANSNRLKGVEIYDPATNSWSQTANMSSARDNYSATVMLNGKVLVSCGYDGTNNLSQAEIYDAGLGYSSARQPVISSATSPLANGAALVLTGSGFRGISEASGGSNNNSASNYPLVQLTSLSNGQTQFLTPDPSAPFSDSSYTSKGVSGFPNGYLQITVFVNGIPSNSKTIQFFGTQAVLASTTTTIGTINPATSVVGQSVTIPFTVTSTTQGTITGNVIVGDGTTSVTVPVSQGSATLAFSSAGTHMITVAYQGDATFAASSATTSYGVNKTTAIVTLSNLNQIFDGNPKSVTVTTVPGNLAVTVTYNGSTIIPFAIGSYNVSAVVSDSNYTGSVTGTLVISGTKLNAAITITNQSQTYDGTAKTVTVTTVPVGLAVGITYNGSTTAPSNAGSYPVVVTVNDAVYMGTASDTLVIAQATTTVAVSNAGLAPGFIYADIQDQPVLLVASVKSAPNLTVTDGTVIFTVLQGQNAVGAATSPVVVSNGQAQATYTLPQFTLYGNYTIKADFSASANFASNSNQGGILVVSNVLNPEQPVITNQRIIFSRVPARTATAVTMTASAFAVSGFPLQTFKWTYYNIDTNTLDGPVVLHKVNGATTDSDIHTFQKDGSYRVYLVVSDGVSSASIGNDINAVQVGKDGTVSLAPNGISTDSNLLITDKTGSDLSSVMNPVNNLGIKLPESVGGVVNFDAHNNGAPILPSDTPGKQKYSLFSTNGDAVTGLDPSYAPISATAVRFGKSGVYSIELRDTSTPKLRVARIMVPVSDPETGGSVAGTDKRTTKRPVTFAFKGSLSGKKPNTITGAVQLELDAGLDLSQPVQMSMGMSNIITDATFNSKGKATWSDPLFSKLSAIMPKLAKGSHLTQQGALMTINYTISAKTPDQIARLQDAMSTEGVVKGTTGVSSALGLQFTAVINGRTYAGRLAATFSRTTDFGTLTGRSTK